MVEDVWGNTDIKGIASFRIAKKLSFLKIEVKKWTKKVDLKEEHNNGIMHEWATLDKLEGESNLDG